MYSKYYKVFLIICIISVANSNDPCGANKPQLLSGSNSGEITSPGFPSTYPNDQNCQWHIQAEIGYIVKIIFLAYSAETE